MIQRMEVLTSRQDAPVLPLSPYSYSANEDPIQIQGIDGLGPVKADITTTPLGNADGEVYQGASVGKRNIVLTLGLNPTWEEGGTIADLRQMLYAYFLTKQWVKLRFFLDHLPASSSVEIEGYVESMEPNIFSKDPEIQISIICPRPDFIDPQPTFVDGVVSDQAAEITESEVLYKGTSPTGFEVYVQSADILPAYTGKLFVTNRTDDLRRFAIDPVTVDTTMAFRLSTIKSAKRAQNVLPDGSVINLLSHVTTVSTWPVLSPGSNLFSVSADQPGQDWKLAYFTRYGAL